VGVHDIKNLKFKLRNPEEAQFNSPWNIAIDFKVDLSFHPEEIAPMLEQYSEAEEVQMDIPAIAERLHYHTSGYPFLVCKICKNIVDDILVQRSNQNHWTLEDVDASVRLLMKERNTNFDSLFGNLENHQDLYDVVERVLLLGERISFNPYNPVIEKGVTYGIFKRNGQLKIHNRIYEQLIYNYLGSKLEVKTYTNKNIGMQFLLANGALDFKLVLERFQQFLKEEHSDKDVKFLERQWRLIFLAFIRPIVNGEGYTFKEVQVSQEKRLDIVVTFHQHRYIVELKNWYGQVYHEKGLDQLADYLDMHNLSEGYLVIFDNRKAKTWAVQTIVHRDKQIYTVWV
ncbi:MAG: GxxExxY protein, partial [Bacteroidota bacterium]